jgi:hypothetical protein
MPALNPLKKTKEHAAEINQRPNRLSGGIKTSELESVMSLSINPCKGKGSS